MDNRKEVVRLLISVVLFTALFASIVVLLSMWVLNSAPNFNSVLSIALSLLCAFPLGYGLFLNSEFTKKGKSYQRIIFPALIFPLCILLSLGSSLYQQRPEGLFKIFVMDPIPNGVSNIQGDDISFGFDTEVILAFSATPETIEKIIAKNELALYDEETASYSIQDPDYKYFQGINWNRNWVVYYKHSSARVEEITIWVNPQKDTVLFRYING